MATKSCGFAPVILFVYNRLWHTQQTITALRQNIGAHESELIIFSDGPLDAASAFEVKAVRQFLRSIHGFKAIHIVEHKRNLGLATNIISGVTEVLSKYGRAIILEDDIITSKYFLTYMNKALDFYEKEKKVWHISGWNYPIDPTGLPDTFLWRAMNCWGWATWTDRWKYFEKDTAKLTSSFTDKAIYKFNIDGHENFWEQILLNINGKINSWAIFWYATIFMNNGLCLNPSLSYARNIGLDGSGVHCKDSGYCCNYQLNINGKPAFPAAIKENEMAVEVIKQYFVSQRKSLPQLIINKIARLVLKKNIF